MSDVRRRRATAPPTLADVAAVAGVSPQTVSNALNSPDLLRPDTLARVRAVVAELGYTPNRAARNLRTRSSDVVGLQVTPAREGTAEATPDRFVHTLVESCRSAGLHVLLFAPDPDDPVRGYDELVRSTAVDAFVVTETFRSNPQSTWLAEHGIPYVAFGRPWEPSIEHTWVDVDGAAGTRAATRHLVERGHTRIAWVGWHRGFPLGDDRRQGWKQEMAAHGLARTGLGARVEDTLASGREAAAVLLDEVAPTAFVCASDTLAMGVLHALADRGLVAGRDVAVVGYDDSQAAHVVPGGLTTVRQPLEDVAVELVRGLRGVLARPPVVRDGVLLEPTLVVRGSS